MQRKIYITTIIFLFLFSVALFAQSVGTLYQDGLHKEETLGDLNAAIESYSKAVEMQQQNRQIAAQAQLRIGFCYEKLSKDTEAKAAFQKVLDMFSEQREVVQIARKHLQELSPGHPYFPLAVGNRWIYDVKERTVEERTMELISSKEDAEGTTWYRAKGSPWEEVGIVDWGVRDDGLFLRVTTRKSEETIPILTSPIESGQKWEYRMKEDEAQVINFQILSAKEKMTTPAGTFEEVIELQFEIPKDETDYFYFAKDVGLVKLTGPNRLWELKEYTLASAQKELTLRIFEPVMELPGLMMLGEEFVTKEELRQKLQEAGRVARLQIITHQAVTLMQLNEITELAKSVGIDKISQTVAKPKSGIPYGFDTPADTFRSLQIFIENEDWESVKECFVPESPPPLDEESKGYAGVLKRKYGTHITHVEQFGDEAIVMVRMIESIPKSYDKIPMRSHDTERVREKVRRQLIDNEERITLLLPASLREGRWLFKAKYSPDWMPPREALRNLGFILDDEWQLMGPFYVPSGELEEPQDVLPENIEELLSQWIQEPFKWTLVDDGKSDAYIDLSTQWLDKNTPNLENAWKQDVDVEKDYWGAYAIAYIQSPDERDVELCLSGSVRCRIWYNGEWLGFSNASRNRYESNPLDMISAARGNTIHLKRGFNPVVVLVGREIRKDENAWGIIGRLNDLEGSPMRDLKFLPAKDYYIYPKFFKKLGY